MNQEGTRSRDYEPPDLRDLGPVADLTQDCTKWFGSGDGFFFNIIGRDVCVSR
jgi:hypothetical protein